MKKAFILFSVLCMLLTTTITVFAATGTFDFTLSPGSDGWTTSVSKADSDQNFYVTVTNGNFISTDRTYFSVRKQSDGLQVGGKLWINDYVTHNMAYAKTTYANNYYFLVVEQDQYSPYGVWVTGRWTP